MSRLDIRSGLVRAQAGVLDIGMRLSARASSASWRAKWVQRLREAIVSSIPEFDAPASDQLRIDVETHASNHVDELHRLLAGGTVREFEFVRDFARRQAAQRFPIEAALQAYRCMLPALQAGVVDGLEAPRPRDRQRGRDVAAALVSEYVGAVGIAFAAAYVTHASELAEAEGDRRTELLGILVGGYDESDARVVRLLKRAGYLEQRLSFCVALAQSTDPLEMENPARVQRIADALTDCVVGLPVRVLVGVRSNLVTAVFSDIRRASGWTAPQSSLALRVEDRLRALGPAVLIGLSGDQSTPSLIPRGLHEATVALDFATVTERVMPFHSLSIRRLLIHRGVEYVQSALPAWFAALNDADAKSRGHLVQTLRALADADMNVQHAARELRVHANTVYARIQRIHDVTGLDAQRYHDLSHLLLALDCRRA